MSLKIGGTTLSFSDVGDSIENFFRKIRSKVLDKVDGSYDYSGGERRITDFFTGDKVRLSSDTQGVEISGNDFVLKAGSGTLTIEHSRDKVIDFSDYYGNTVVYAYFSSGAGVIDGRGFLNFEIIVGANYESNHLIAGDAGANLWGGAGFSADILVGGLGADNFLIGKNEGNDYISNAGAGDTIDLYDATLSDLISTAVNESQVSVAFNTGAVLTVENADTVTPVFQLADGGRYAYNRAANSWQSA